MDVHSYHNLLSSLSLIMTQNIHTIRSLLVKKYGDPYGYEHFWPANKASDYHNIVFHTLKDWRDTYVKWFTDDGRYRWKHEFDLTTKLNEFSSNKWSIIAWPKLLEEHEEPCYHFLSEKITYDKVDFWSMSAQELFEFYHVVSWEFDVFMEEIGPICNRYNLGGFSKQLWKVITQLQKYSEKIKQIKKVLLLLLQKIEIQQVKRWILNGESYKIDWTSFVKSVVQYDKKELIGKLNSLFEWLEPQDYHFANWSFYGWKVYWDIKEKVILTDLDRVWPQYRWKDFLWLVWSHIWLNTYSYENYEQYRGKFLEVQSKIDLVTNNNALSNLLIYCKLIGIIFNDYGWLMLHKESNRSSIESIWQPPEWNSKQWIIWNFNLLSEYFGIHFKELKYPG